MRQAFLILGMHRGGTSALAGTLVHLGITPPKTLMSADANNERGYWESVRICGFHDRLLSALGTSWDAWTPLGEWPPTTGEDEWARELAGLIASEFGQSDRIIVKDPRICRFAALWFHALDIADIRAATVIVVRSPWEVAASLASRNRIDVQSACLVWLRHMLDAEQVTRGRARSIVSYAGLLGDWRAVVRAIASDLHLEPGILRESIGREVDGFLHHGLRHHTDTPAARLTSPLSDWITGSMAAFDRLVHGSESARADACLVLDRIRVGFDQAASAFGAPDERARHERLGALEQERIRLGDALAALEQRTAALAVECSRLQQRANELEAQHARDEIERAELRSRASETAARAAQFEQWLLNADTELSSVRRHRDALLASGSWRVTAPLRAAFRMAKALVGRR